MTWSVITRVLGQPAAFHFRDRGRAIQAYLLSVEAGESAQLQHDGKTFTSVRANKKRQRVHWSQLPENLCALKRKQRNK